MELSKKILTVVSPDGQKRDTDALFGLPERVLQFGTGVLLRGLPDHFIDRANRQGFFNGRIVVIKSTSSGGTDAFAKQDGLYTLVERGIVNGAPVENIYVNASISRVLSANDEWDAIMQCAGNADLQVIISNTTEVGITLVESDATAERPVSFPGRLLAFLVERCRVFNGNTEAGMVILPTELIVDNGTRLREIVLELARLRGVASDVADWLANANEFCNTLVDCIVPGKMDEAEHRAFEQKLGYTDELMIMSEPYRLWAIETSGERTRQILSFSACNPGVILTPDIGQYRELKLRLLNATHTLSCALACLAGFVTVKDAMLDRPFELFIASLVHEEIVPLVGQQGISLKEAKQFAGQVIDRFRNPYIDHAWLSISAQYISKMEMRVAPLVRRHYAQGVHTPVYMSLGFAAFVLFLRTKKTADGFFGGSGSRLYKVNDDKAALLSGAWDHGPGAAVDAAMEAVGLAGMNGADAFSDQVKHDLHLLMQSGVQAALLSLSSKKAMA